MIVRELLTRLGFRIDNSNLIIYNTTINNIHNAADRASNALQGLFGLLATGASLVGVSKIADDMQNLEARIKLLPQTTGDIGEAFDEVSRHANEARQPLKEYAKLYVRIGHAAKSYLTTQDEALSVTDTISKGLIVGGASAQESASVMTQLSQALGSGVLQGQEFNSMAEGAPQLLDALSVAMGYPREQLKKLASQGKLTTKDLILAFKKIGPEVERQFLSMPINIGQAMTLIGNRFVTFIARINRESRAVTKIAEFFVETFKSIEKSLDSMVDFFGGATNTLKFFGIALAAVFAPMAFKAAAAGIAFLFTPLALLIATLLLVGLAIEDFYSWMDGGKSIFGDWLGNFADAKKEFDKFSESLYSFFTTGEMGKFTAKLVDLKNGIVKAFDGGVLSKFFAALGRVFDFIAKNFPLDAVLKNMALVFGGLATAFFGIIDVIAGAFKVLVGFLTGDFDLFYEGIGQIFSGILDIVLGVGATLLGMFLNLFETLKLWNKIAFEAIGSFIVDSVFGAFKDATDRGIKYIKGMLGRAISFGVDAVVGLVAGQNPSVNVPARSPDAIPVGSQTALPRTSMASVAGPAIDAIQRLQGVSMQKPYSIAPSTVAGAASAPSGVPGVMFNVPAPVNVSVYQTLPPGTPAEMAKAAKDATVKAADASFSPIARQMGQLQ